jgi:hypothetical protein
VSPQRTFKEHCLVVVGSAKMAVFDEAAKQTLVTYPRVNWPGPVPTAAEDPGEPVAVDATEPITAECLAFLESLDTRRPPVTAVPEELRVLEVLDACSRSLAHDGVRTMVQPQVRSRHPHLRICRVRCRHGRQMPIASVGRQARMAVGIA